jgi:hypothetical protein
VNVPASFTCIICGAANDWSDAVAERETPSCGGCQSNGRYRATVAALLDALVGERAPLPLVTPRPDVRGLGIGDWPGYDWRMARVFGYTNTHLDTDPRLDLTEEPAAELVGVHDFVTAGEVLEHVAPPVEAAVTNLRRLLVPGGVAVLTVPFTSWPEHIENFPHLHEWQLVRESDRPVLVNRRRDGTVERCDDLVFHGPGGSLEMRKFTERSFLDVLRAGGFDRIRVAADPDPGHGIVFDRWPGPVVAYAP